MREQTLVYPSRSILPIKMIENIGKRCLSRIQLTLQGKKWGKKGKQPATSKEQLSRVKQKRNNEILTLII